LTRPLARTNTTCTYDRVGTGRSSPPREARRTIDDVVSDLHALLHEAGVHPPYLLVGQSAGGNIAADYAAQYRAEVAGLVLLDVGAPTGQLGKEFPGKLGWNGAEHVDWVDADRRHLRRPRALGDTPVRIVRAAAGDSNARDVSYWLKLGPLARQVTLEGGHDIHEDNPAGVLHQIRATLAAIDARG
jgi:pimeloyl-ACP methyl ester carboxylesterase